MGAITTVDGDETLICYDRTVGHNGIAAVDAPQVTAAAAATAGAADAATPKTAMPYNSVYCFSLRPKSL